MVIQTYTINNLADEINSDASITPISDGGDWTHPQLNAVALTPVQLRAYAELYESDLGTLDILFSLSMVSDEICPLRLADALFQEACKHL